LPHMVGFGRMLKHHTVFGDTFWCRWPANDSIKKISRTQLLRQLMPIWTYPFRGFYNANKLTSLRGALQWAFFLTSGSPVQWEVAVVGHCCLGIDSCLTLINLPRCNGAMRSVLWMLLCFLLPSPNKFWLADLKWQFGHLLTLSTS
jgi:hypothetical protein